MSFRSLTPFRFVLNGQAGAPPVTEDRPFRELMTSLRATYPGNPESLSEVRVGGIEIGDGDESLLADTPLSQLGRVEIRTRRLVELAHETLSMVRDYTMDLEALCRSVADGVIEARRFDEEYPRLIDGISTLAEAVDGVKALANLAPIAEVTALEQDLLDAVRAVVACHESAQYTALATLLQEDLPENLDLWRSRGIPLLMAAVAAE